MDNNGEFTITLADFAKSHGGSRSTASRELNKMIESNLLTKKDIGNGTAKFSLATVRDGTYRNLWDYWNTTFKH